MSIITKFLPALILSALASSASATVVDYSLTISNAYAATGQFTGVDGNGDGMLNLNELSALKFDLDAANYHFTLGDVSHFGSYNIAQNLWQHDAGGWNQSNFAYVSFFNGSLSANTRNTTNVITLAAAAALSVVPEPAPIALFALGLLAIGTLRRSKK